MDQKKTFFDLIKEVIPAISGRQAPFYSEELIRSCIEDQPPKQRHNLVKVLLRQNFVLQILKFGVYVFALWLTLKLTGKG